MMNRARELGVGDSFDNAITQKRLKLRNPDTDPDTPKFVDQFLEIRQAIGKPISREEAEKKIRNPLYFGGMLARDGQVDGAVAGALNTTRDTIRAAISTVGCNGEITSYFVMLHPDKKRGVEGAMIYGDCAVIPNPTPEQLAMIASKLAKAAKQVLQVPDQDKVVPRVAVLCYGTGDSGEGPDIDNVRTAVDLIRHDEPGLVVAGPIQYDAAMVPEVAETKCKTSELKQVGGKANVLIFPDLKSGNITYKADERAGDVAIGPVLKGLKIPFNDLSRGCREDDDNKDISNMVVQTVLQCDKMRQEELLFAA